MILTQWAERIGQNLFYPPNVGGWNEGRSWLGSRSVIARANFANALVKGELWHPASVPDFDQLANRNGIAEGLPKRISWLAELFWGGASTDAVRETEAKLKAVKNGSMATAVALLLSGAQHQLA